MNAISPDELRQYIRQVTQQEEAAFNIQESQPVDFSEYRRIVETVANAAAHWAIGMARDDNEIEQHIAEPLPEAPGV